MNQFEEEDKNEINCDESQHLNDGAPQFNNELERGAFFDNVVAAEDLEEEAKFAAEGLDEQLRSLSSFIQDENCAEGAKENDENESLRGQHGAERQELKESAEEDEKVGVDEAIIQQEEIL